MKKYYLALAVSFWVSSFTYAGHGTGKVEIEHVGSWGGGMMLYFFIQQPIAGNLCATHIGSVGFSMCQQT